MKRFLLHVNTEWCGEDNTYAAYAKSEDELYDFLEELAHENFSDFGGFEKVLEELFPGVQPGDYTEEMYEKAAEREGEYYYGSIEEWDETRSEEEWDNYPLVRDEFYKYLDNDVDEDDDLDEEEDD